MKLDTDAIMDADDYNQKAILKRAVEEMKGPSKGKKPIDIEVMRKRKGKKSKAKRKSCGCK